MEKVFAAHSRRQADHENNLARVTISSARRCIYEDDISLDLAVMLSMHHWKPRRLGDISAEVIL